MDAGSCYGHLVSALAFLWRIDIPEHLDREQKVVDQKPMHCVRSAAQYTLALDTYLEHIVDDVEFDRSLATNAVVHLTCIKIH